MKNLKFFLFLSLLLVFVPTPAKATCDTIEVTIFRDVIMAPHGSIDPNVEDGGTVYDEGGGISITHRVAVDFPDDLADEDIENLTVKSILKNEYGNTVTDNSGNFVFGAGNYTVDASAELDIETPNSGNATMSGAFEVVYVTVCTLDMPVVRTPVEISGGGGGWVGTTFAAYEITPYIGYYMEIHDSHIPQFCPTACGPTMPVSFIVRGVTKRRYTTHTVGFSPNGCLTVSIRTPWSYGSCYDKFLWW
jgi:hypothetical protein